MKTMKGPAIFLAQFAGDAAPYNSLKGMAQWAASLGYKGIQIPTWEAAVRPEKASGKTYCDKAGLPAQASRSQNSRRIWGRLVAVPGLRRGFGFAAESAAAPRARNRRKCWEPRRRAILTSTHGLLLRRLAFPYLYPLPPRRPV
jgi:hypothetical protein